MMMAKGIYRKYIFALYFASESSFALSWIINLLQLGACRDPQRYRKTLNKAFLVFLMQYHQALYIAFCIHD